MAATCTAAGLLAIVPSAETISDSNLDAIMALILCEITGAGRGDCTAETLLDDSKCFCISDHQKKAALVNLLYNYAVEQGFMTAGSNLQQLAWRLANTPPELVRAIILKQLCTWINSL